MRRKFRQFARLPKGAWLRRGDQVPLYAHLLQDKTRRGIEYQHYCYTAQGKGLCCGVAVHESADYASANQIAHLWHRWRKERRAIGLDDPKIVERIGIMIFHPIGEPDNKTRIDLTEGS